MEITMLSKHSIDLTGQRFGSLVAVAPKYKEADMWYWEFKCDCGSTHIARGNTIKHQAKLQKEGIPSCGCVELANKTKHGFRKAKDTHPAYRAYRGMINRCYNPKDANYKWYGAVGVTVCDEWLNKPAAFVQWSIDNGWNHGLHVDKDILCKKLNIIPHVYSPTTCQWVTPQANVAFATNRDNFGKHPNVRLSNDEVCEIERLYFSGEQTNMSELARQFGLMSSSSIHRIIKIAKSKVSANDTD
jgi:hypothetical protein